MSLDGFFFIIEFNSYIYQSNLFSLGMKQDLSAEKSFIFTNNFMTKSTEFTQFKWYPLCNQAFIHNHLRSTSISRVINQMRQFLCRINAYLVWVLPKLVQVYLVLLAKSLHFLIVHPLLTYLHQHFLILDQKILFYPLGHLHSQVLMSQHVYLCV